MRWVNRVGLVLLVVLGVAGYDSLRPVRTWREPGPLVVCEGQGRVWVLLQVQRRFRGQGWLVNRGPLPPLHFHEVLELSARTLRRLSEATLVPAPDLTPGGEPLRVGAAGPEVGRGARVHHLRTARWEPGARSPGEGAPPLVHRDRLAVGELPVTLADGRVLTLEARTGADSWSLDLRLPGEAGTLPVHRIDTEAAWMDPALLREQRSQEALGGRGGAQ